MLPAGSAWVFLLLMVVVSARAVEVRLSNPTVEGIQAAINAANTGDTIIIPAATIDFGTGRLTLNKTGVSLRGAGSSSTIFISSQSISPTDPTKTPCTRTIGSTIQDPLLCVADFNPGAGASPNIIEKIGFRNEAQQTVPITQPYRGPGIGIAVRASGPPGNPSIVRDCRFRGFWRDGAAGMGILFGTNFNDWRVEGNSFVNTKQPIYYFQQRNLTITENTMTRFVAGIQVDAGQRVYNLEITHNTLNADWDNTNFLQLPFLADVFRGISLPAESNPGEPNRNWVVRNNLITGVTQGIRVRYTSGNYSLQDVHIDSNFINVTRCGRDITPCPRAEVINFAPAQLVVANNWWGKATGPRYVVNTTNIVQYEDWIVSYKNSTPCFGFCPTDVVLGNGVKPVITNVAAPNQVSAGEFFVVTVTLRDAVLNARLEVSAARRGGARQASISCQPVPLFSGTTVSTTCAVDAGAPNGAYVVTADVTTPGNGGQATDSSATVTVVNGPTCISPASIQLLPSQVTVNVNEQLPVLGTVLDANQAPLPDVPVTFIITFTPHQPTDYTPSGYTASTGAQPTTTNQTVVTDSAGQALLLVAQSEPGQVTVQASALDCSGNLVTSNTATVTFLSGKEEHGGGYNDMPAHEDYQYDAHAPHSYRGSDPDDDRLPNFPIGWHPETNHHGPGRA